MGASCTAELIQDDPGGLAEALGLPVPVVALECRYRRKNFGADETFYQIMRKLAHLVGESAEITYRLIGPTALGFRHRDDIAEITKLLNELGVQVNVCAPMHETPDDIANLGRAHFNVWYPETGETACRHMERTLDCRAKTV